MNDVGTGLIGPMGEPQELANFDGNTEPLFPLAGQLWQHGCLNHCIQYGGMEDVWSELRVCLVCFSGRYLNFKK